jgi:hypothetical protein
MPGALKSLSKPKPKKAPLDLELMMNKISKKLNEEERSTPPKVFEAVTPSHRFNRN